MSKSKRIGALLSYVATILNTAISLFLTPFVLSSLGDAQYGVYRTVQSLTSQLAMVSIGIGTIAAVMIAKYNARTDSQVQRDKENFMAIGVSIATVISVLAMLIGFILSFFVDSLYSRTMNAEQLALVQKLFVVLVVNVGLYLFRDIFVGVINGCERFVFSNSLKVARLVLRCVLIYMLLSMGMGAVALVLCDLGLTVFMLVCDLIYCFGILKIKIKFYFFDKALIKSVFTFAMAMLLQTIINQVNQNLDGVILGVMIPPERVAVYSLALTVYVAFSGLASSVSTLFTPEAARLVQQGADTDRLMNFTVKVGRTQGLVVGLILGGFIAAGREFVGIWVGREKLDVYYISLILMVPTSIAVMQTGAKSVLDGMMKRMGRSLILIVATVINLVSSMIMIRYFDYWGAALGTALSVLLGEILALSLYYKKTFGFRLGAFMLRTFKGILPCAVLGILVTLPLGTFPLGDAVLFLLKGIVFVAVYGGGLLLFGLNPQEKCALLGKVMTKTK